MARRGGHRSPDGASVRSLLWSLQWFGDAATTRTRGCRPQGYSAWRSTGGFRVRQRAQPPPRARTARWGERDTSQAWQSDVAGSRDHRAKMRAAFPRQLYRRGALAESVFSAVKRKLSARAPGRSLEMQRMQALVVGLAYNLYRLRPCPI